jgi:hypothetical protein
MLVCENMLSNILNLWPRSLRRRSAAARSLGLRIRIPSASFKYVTLECWTLSGKELCDGPIPVQRNPTECDTSNCDLGISTMRRPRPE